MPLYTYLTCVKCKLPVMEAKVLPDGVFLVAGARCKKCGGEQFYCDNGFNPKDYVVTDPVDVQHEKGEP